MRSTAALQISVLAILIALVNAAPSPAQTAVPRIVRGLAAYRIEDTLVHAQRRLKEYASAQNDYGRLFGRSTASELEPIRRDYLDIRVWERGVKLERRQSQQSATVSVNVYNVGYLDSQYSAPIGVGTPAQLIPVLFDLGSAAIYVPTSACKTSLCTGQAKFNPSQSSTFVNTTERAASVYQQGGALGYVIEDRVSLGGNLAVNNFTLLAAVYVTNGDLSSSNPDAGQQPTLAGAGAGILGLSYSAFTVANSTESVSGQQTIPDAAVYIRQTLVGALVANKELSQNIMGLFLQRAEDSPSYNSISPSTGALVSGSELCLGCVDSQKYTGSITTVSLIQPTVGYWLARMGGLSVGGQTISGSSNLAAVFDSGFTLAPLPVTAAANFARAAGATRASSLDDSFGGQAYSISCSAKPDVSISFGGASFKVDYRDLIVPVGTNSVGSTICALTIIGLGSLPSGVEAIIGIPFLKSLYTVYDYDNGGSVGIAQAVTSTSSTIVQGQTSAATGGSSSGSGSGSGGGSSNGGGSASKSAAIALRRSDLLAGFGMLIAAFALV